jgi:PAS domain S-box-containing protein
MKRTLKGKITLIYLCLVIVIAIVGAVSAVNLYKLSKSINGLMVDNYRSINAVSNMFEAIERQDSAVLIYINIDRHKGISLFTDNSNVFWKWFNIENNNITEHGEKDYVDKINIYYTNYIELFSQLQEIRNNDGLGKSVAFYNSTILPDFTKLKQEMKELSQLNEKAMFAGKIRATNDARQSMYIILGLSFVAVVGGFLLSRFFTNRFLKPIFSLTQTVKLVKAGDLNQQIRVNTNDEIGKLSQEFNNMTQRLQQFEKSTLGKLMSEKNKSIAIVKSISDPLIVLDTNYKIILLNDACEKFFDIQEEKVVNKHFLEAIRNGEVFEYISSVLVAKEDYKEKIINIQSDDEYYFKVVVTTINGIDANITGIIVVFQNVTQLKKLERIKTDFVATISHEFKTPLTSVIMGTSMILEESMGALNEDQRSVMDTINEDEIKLSNLVNELMELSKIESDKAIFNIHANSIEGIIDTSVKQFYEQAQRKDVSLYYELDDDLPRVNADFEKITWVINNLITNALKYTDAGDEICITAKTKEGKMFVSVKDTGVGIPPEFLDKIFGKFVQVKGYDMEVRGTGLGLSIVKEIIEAHGGEIWCESKLDVGSNFIFTLPLSEES